MRKGNSIIIKNYWGWKMNKYLTIPIRVEEVNREKNWIETKGVKICMGIIKPNGDLEIPEQVRK